MAKQKSVKLIEVKSEVGAGTRGASLGIEAIKIAALDFRSTFFKKYRSMAIPDDNAAVSYTHLTLPTIYSV